MYLLVIGETAVISTSRSYNVKILDEGQKIER